MLGERRGRDHEAGLVVAVFTLLALGGDGVTEGAVLGRRAEPARMRRQTELRQAVSAWRSASSKHHPPKGALLGPPPLDLHLCRRCPGEWSPVFERSESRVIDLRVPGSLVEALPIGRSGAADRDVRSPDVLRIGGREREDLP